MKKVGIALLGLGTVGSGTYKILTKSHDDIMTRYGVDLEIRHILEKDMSKVEALGIDPAIVSCDIENVLADDGISIVAEFFGGIEPAKTFLLKSLLAGKSIVTANKEMFSKNWHELEKAAKKGNAGLYFEASCVGGVPIIRALQESMQGNDIQALKGIVNGTTNFILTKMADEGQEYSDVLKEAQRLGYAEANPSADVDGFDSMYKLSILSSLAFHTKVPITKIYREGIANVTKTDIDFGKRFGYTLKLLAIGKKNAEGKIEARVHPAFVPNDHPLATVKGSFNAVHIVGDNVGDLTFFGRGAGDMPTGSAIVSDIVYCATQTKHKLSTFRNTTTEVGNKNFAFDFISEYYVRISAKDVAGVLASVSGVFGKYGISIRSMQQEVVGDEATVIFMTHKTNEKTFNNACKDIKNVRNVKGIEAIIRVEE